MILKFGPTDVVDPFEHVVDAVVKTLLGLHVVERARQGAFGAGAVVANDVDDQRVVTYSQGVQRVDDASRLRVDVLEEPGKYFLHPGVQTPLIIGAVIPCRNFIRPLRQDGVLGDDTQIDLVFEREFSLPIPTVVELALVLVGPFLGDVMRRVRRAWSPIDEERLIWRRRLLFAHPGNRVICNGLREMPSLFSGRFDRRRIADQRCRPLVSLTTEEAIEILKPLPCRPMFERSRWAGLIVGRVVPLSERGAAVAIAGQNGRNRSCIRWPTSVITGVGRSELHDVSGVHRMVVAP